RPPELAAHARYITWLMPRMRPRHGAHDVEREIRHLVDHESKLALIDQRELARLFDARSRTARRAVDHRHESDRLVGSADLDHFVADRHFDHAGLHDIHAAPGITFVEHDAARRERYI